MMSKILRGIVMRRFLLLACLSVVCLWGQIGHSDIYVWTDENNVKHLTNRTPPPHAQILMRTEEIPYDEAADRARREKEQREEVLRHQAELREKQAALEARLAESRQRLKAAERRADEALQRLEDLQDAHPDGDDQYVGRRHYGFPVYGYPPYGVTFYGTPFAYGKKPRGFKGSPVDKNSRFRKPFETNKFHRNDVRSRIGSGGRPSLGHKLKGGGSPSFRDHPGSRTFFTGRSNGSEWRH